MMEIWNIMGGHCSSDVAISLHYANIKILVGEFIYLFYFPSINYWYRNPNDLLHL